jgi:hypothetical protein
LTVIVIILAGEVPFLFPLAPHRKLPAILMADKLRAETGLCLTKTRWIVYDKI